MYEYEGGGGFEEWMMVLFIFPRNDGADGAKQNERERKKKLRFHILYFPRLSEIDGFFLVAFLLSFLLAIHCGNL